ncbi:MAG: UDP-N-acetylmuramoyl-tripeptide--D-alanyl-D-alanine ligase, partial [Gammaproteobacteria bacterium]|nr:UDP-N-acetylmuramoyl-tripeptide--D-alanyl-D-alanine ligase [Gammaproteobacteria bacterium]
AAQKGAIAAVVDREIISDIPLIKVKDTFSAYGELAKARREAVDIPVCAVTGSCGKTTTKTMLASILSQCGSTLATEQNLNNNIGVPLTLLRLTPEHKFAVIEIGASLTHEIAYAAKLAQPDIAIITCAAPVHLDGFGDLDGVARVKGNVLQGLTADGVAVLNADDSYFSYWRDLLGNKRCVSFGIENSADVTAHSIEIASDITCFELQTPQGKIKICLPVFGKHNIMNALAASAAAEMAGASLTDIKQGLETMQPVAKRMISKIGLNGATIIDDSYNANPRSMQVALDSLRYSAGEKILVVGDMAELGANAAQYHQDLGLMAKEKAVDHLYAIGDLTRLTVETFGDGSYFFTDRNELIAELKNKLRPETTVLVKGSKVNRMWEIVAVLTTVNEE